MEKKEYPTELEKQFAVVGEIFMKEIVKMFGCDAVMTNHLALKSEYFNWKEMEKYIIISFPEIKYLTRTDPKESLQ